MVEVAGALDWGSFFIGVVFSAGVAVFFDLVRQRRNLKTIKLENALLKKQLLSKKEKIKKHKKDK